MSRVAPLLDDSSQSAYKLQKSTGDAVLSLIDMITKHQD